jgi:iron complex outermembrane receptor protein
MRIPTNRSSLALLAATCAAVASPQWVQAQEGAHTLEEIQVTGSRIKRQDLEGVGPVTVFNSAAIEATGITSTETLLQRFSASAGAAGNQGNAYWTGNGYGTAQVNLRGLGINRTLVLVNGRRVVNGGTGANSAVDLNMIPTAIIDRIEVLKDGASAVYGADAVADWAVTATAGSCASAAPAPRAGVQPISPDPIATVRSISTTTRTATAISSSRTTARATISTATSG